MEKLINVVIVLIVLGVIGGLGAYAYDFSSAEKITEEGEVYDKEFYIEYSCDDGSKRRYNSFESAGDQQDCRAVRHAIVMFKTASEVYLEKDSMKYFRTLEIGDRVEITYREGKLGEYFVKAHRVGEL